MHSNPALEPPHAHCFAPQASADLRLLAAFAPQTSSHHRLSGALAPQASSRPPPAQAKLSTRPPAPRCFGAAGFHDPTPRSQLWRRRLPRPHHRSLRLRRRLPRFTYAARRCARQRLCLHSQLVTRGARRDTEAATPSHTRWLAALSVAVHTGRRRPGQPLDHQLAASGIVRGLELEPPSLRPAPRPRADSRPIARSQVPGVTPARLPLNQRSSPMMGWCSGRSAVGLVVLSRWRWPWGGALRSGSPRALHSRAYRTTRWLSHSGRRWLLHGSQRA